MERPYRQRFGSSHFFGDFDLLSVPLIQIPLFNQHTYTSAHPSLSGPKRAIRSKFLMERPYLLDLEVTMEQANYLAGHTKRYDHANEERYGAAIEALDEAGKTSSAEALAATSDPSSGICSPR